MSTQTFDEQAHPRATTGKFAAKPVSEATGGLSALDPAYAAQLGMYSTQPVLEGFSDATLRMRGMPVGRLKPVANPLAADQGQHVAAVADATLDALASEDGWAECEPITSQASDYVQTSRALRLVGDSAFVAGPDSRFDSGPDYVVQAAPAAGYQGVMTVVALDASQEDPWSSATYFLAEPAPDGHVDIVEASYDSHGMLRRNDDARFHNEFDPAAVRCASGSVSAASRSPTR
ncbi:hypothetical protein ACFWGN_11920 [Oerskovia sp. NPDC060338]|uniref:hypothetical protein n=1 Tax=Oerskovia sp. NPDC060338 TaxID=3347100 RepID=UPI003664485F